MISATQARQYLDQALGVGVPDFILQAAMDRVATAEQAMTDAGYSAPTQILIQSMAVAIIAASGSPRRLTSQHAPSGAARTFKYSGDDLTALRRTLAALDTAGTVTDLLGPDPSSSTLLMVVC
jgi:hypothetical protein